MNLTIFQHAKSNPRVGLKLDNAYMTTNWLAIKHWWVYYERMCHVNLGNGTSSIPVFRGHSGSTKDCPRFSGA